MQLPWWHIPNARMVSVADHEQVADSLRCRLYGRTDIGPRRYGSRMQFLERV